MLVNALVQEGPGDPLKHVASVESLSLALSLRLLLPAQAAPLPVVEDLTGAADLRLPYP